MKMYIVMDNFVPYAYFSTMKAAEDCLKYLANPSDFTIQPMDIFDSVDEWLNSSLND